MRALKILGFVLAGLVVLAVAAGAALWFGGGSVLAWAIEKPGSAYFGRNIKIDGPLKIHWGAPTTITAENVHLANASWGSQPDMFTAKHLEIVIYLRTLLHGPARIPQISLDGATLLLEKSKDGQVNWKFHSGAPKKRREFPDLERFIVRDGAFTFHNGVTGAQTELGVNQLDYEAPNPKSPVKIGFDGTFQKAPLRLSGTVAPLAELRDTSKPYPVAFYAALAQSRAVAEGTIAEPLDFAGLDLRLSLSGEHLAEIAAMLGVPLPELPVFRGTAELTGGNGDWALKAMSLKLGQSDLEGGIAVNTNTKVPHIDANFTSSFIDLADFKGFYGGKPANSAAPPKPPSPDGRVVPDTPIAIHKLPGIDADLNIYGGRIRSTGGLPLERVTFGLKLENGELTLKPLNFHLADGDIALNAHFTPFTKEGPPRLQGGIDVRHIDLHKLLSGTAMSDLVKRSAGVVGGFVTIDTRGVSLRDFFANANGDIGLFMENGQVSDLLQELAPIDVLGVLGVYIAGDKPVPINCFVSRFDVKAGVATATTLLLKTPATTVVGTGNLNLGSETIYLKLTPYNNDFTLVSLRTPVEIQGTFRKPSYHVDKAGLIGRIGAAVGLGILFPPAALLPLIDTGLGEHNTCSRAYAAQNPPGNPEPKSGSSAPKK